eukprot:CAMPEP_0194132280 /NCGR_PEP_ID=MMETSP0152-20130528/2785_1 /TAXON_ID=1049557 /ORGANISM="Thalassiothrix antarctica, Strain L6-D1" /LENGTH=688 /DNA_ID=CAMNT_0038827275 /DNA_START=140 /DNA_END=2206 /DNA_ORIENTATION=+
MAPKETSDSVGVELTISASEAMKKDNDKMAPALEREPFFAFIPKVAMYFGGIIGGELKHVMNGITGFPSGSKNYVGGTFSFYKENPKILYDEVISGFTVAIMQVPESIAFSFVAGVPPLSGLHATFWMALITGLLGGKPGMISGAAGALAVVVTKLTAEDGELSYLNKEERLDVLYMTMFVCGLFQILFAILRLAKLVRLIPETGMIGFMNGLAIIIFMAQLPAFKKCDVEGKDYFVECDLDERQWLTFQDNTWELILTLVQVVLCMAVMKFFPKVPKIGKIIPASLVGLLLGALLEHTLFRMAFDVSTRTVKETAIMKGSFPKFDWPNQFPTASGDTWSVIIIYGITLAAIGGVESVLTLQACNEITDTVPKISDSNQELSAQGLANLVSGLFQAMGGNAMIGQSTINIMNGARYRVSSTMSGIFMLLFVVVLDPFINLLPIGTLTGVLFMVVLSTFQWKTFVILRYGRLSDSVAILLVTIIAVVYNLAVAIAVGIIFSALIHAWDSGSHVSGDITNGPLKIDGELCEDVKYVHVKGSIFFGSARHFINMFSVADDPATVVIDFKDALIIDHSAVAAIQGITHRFEKADKRVLITNLPVKSQGRLQRTHGDYDMLARTIKTRENFGDVESNGKSIPEQQQQHQSHVIDPNPHSVSNLEVFHVDEKNVDQELSQLVESSQPVKIQKLE